MGFVVGFGTKENKKNATEERRNSCAALSKTFQGLLLSVVAMGRRGWCSAG